jgi:hypothetical protein
VLVFSLVLVACSSGSDAAGDAGSTGPVADAAATSVDASSTDAGAADALAPDASAGDASTSSDAAPVGDANAPAGEATVTFANASGTNANTATYSAASTTSASATQSQTEVTVITGSIVRTVTFTLKSAYAAGKTYALGSPDNTTDEATLAYTEKSGQWYATGGTVTVESVGTKRFVFHVKDATMVPGPQEKVAVGTFTLKVDGPTTVN